MKAEHKKIWQRPRPGGGKAIKPDGWHRFYINTLAPLFEDPWRWIRYVIGIPLLLGVGFCSAAIADYFISGAINMQSIDDIKVIYYDAALKEAPGDKETPPTGAVETSEPDDGAMKAYLALKEINPEAAGWISIPGTQIDYPIAQGQDNKYYLKHSFQKKKSAHACIFLDCRNERGDLNYVVYGHDMKDRTFFGSLSDYQDEQFCREHQTIELNLRGETARWKIFSVHMADDTAVPVIFESFDEYTKYIENAAGASEFDLGVDVDSNDTILTLSTCGSGNSRLLVQAVRVK